MKLSKYWYNELKTAIESAREAIKKYEAGFHDPTVLKVAKEMHNYANGIFRNSSISDKPDPNLEYKLLAITDGLREIIKWANILKEPYMEEVYKILLEEAKQCGGVMPPQFQIVK